MVFLVLVQYTDKLAMRIDITSNALYIIGQWREFVLFNRFSDFYLEVSPKEVYFFDLSGRPRHKYYA